MWIRGVGVGNQAEASAALTPADGQRVLLVAIEVEEGRSIGEVARSWGVSRQLASRWVQESATLRH